jgi:predicted amidophosphoribosyltransferase
MTEQQQEMARTKTCPACGGTWPSDRRNCLACGANLESVPARLASEEQGQQPLDWAWLDAMADEHTASETSELADAEQKPGCLSRIFAG